MDEQPFNVDKILFMDWRDSHLINTVLKKGNRKLPIFLYAMSFSPGFASLTSSNSFTDTLDLFPTRDKEFERQCKGSPIQVQSPTNTTRLANTKIDLSSPQK